MRRKQHNMRYLLRLEPQEPQDKTVESGNPPVKELPIAFNPNEHRLIQNQNLYLVDQNKAVIKVHYL
jgi:hypothetical protein